MATHKLCDSDANLYRLYAVGLLGYDDALSQARSEFRLRQAMLAFDQDAARRREDFVHTPLSVDSSSSP